MATLPKRRGYTIVHFHAKGKPCVVRNPRHVLGPAECRYTPNRRNMWRAFFIAKWNIYTR